MLRPTEKASAPEKVSCYSQLPRGTPAVHRATPLWEAPQWDRRQRDEGRNVGKSLYLADEGSAGLGLEGFNNSRGLWDQGVALVVWHLTLG